MSNEIEGAPQDSGPRLASRLLAILTDPADNPPTVSCMIERAQAAFEVVDWAVAPLTRGTPEIWKAHIAIRWPAAPPTPDGGALTPSPPFNVRSYEIWLQKQAPLEGWHFEELDLTQEEYLRTRSAVWSIGIGTLLEDSVLVDYHRLARMAYALSPAAPAYLDIASCMLKPGRWLREVAQCPIAPSPRHLFSIHSVSGGPDDGKPNNGKPDDGKPDNGKPNNGDALRGAKTSESVWLHTHGLLRCGSIEFEILGVPQESFTQAVELLETISIHAIEEGAGPPGVPFSPGENIVMEWLEWPEALRWFAGLRGAKPQDRDDFHRLTSGVLVERTGWPLWRRYRAPLGALHDLAKGAPLYFSDAETLRMRQIATIRYRLFRRVFEKHRHDSNWNFFAKFGYPTDHAKEGSDCEHLWFQCLKMEDTRIFGLLVNEPLDIARLREGQSDWHELSRLTDWRVQVPERLYDPDSIVLLDEIASEL